MKPAVITVYYIYDYAVLKWQRLPINWSWLAEVIYWLLLFLLSYRYMRSKKWHNTFII